MVQLAGSSPFVLLLIGPAIEAVLLAELVFIVHRNRETEPHLVLPLYSHDYFVKQSLSECIQSLSYLLLPSEFRIEVTDLPLRVSHIYVIYCETRELSFERGR